MRMSRRRLVLTHLVLWIALGWAITPVLWTLLSSFKPESDIFSTRIELFTRFTFENYIDLLERGNFVTWGFNSILVATLTTGISVFLASTAAYAISRFRYRGRSASLYVFLVAQMFPAIILLVPLYRIFVGLGWLDTPLSLIFAYATFAIPFSILMLKGYFDTIPYELEEAGRVDGLGVFGSFWRIVMPLSIPGIAVTAFFAFITAWNEFLFARAFLTNRDAMTLPVGMSTFIDPLNQPWGILTAASVLISLPVMILFYVAQKYLISGMTTGGVKG